MEYLLGSQVLSSIAQCAWMPKGSVCDPEAGLGCHPHTGVFSTFNRMECRLQTLLSIVFAVGVLKLGIQTEGFSPRSMAALAPVGLQVGEQEGEGQLGVELGSSVEALTAQCECAGKKRNEDQLCC